MNADKLIAKLDDPSAGAENWAAQSKSPRRYHEDVAHMRLPRNLIEAMRLAVQLDHPLLLTGKPGTGKTTAPYWFAWKLGVAPDDVFHIEVRSDSEAQDLRYHYDAVEHLRRAQLGGEVSRGDMVIRGALWDVYAASQERPVVVVFDEIDKAPRDFPNDLLFELDVRGFDLPRRDGGPTPVRGKRDNLVLIAFTSNGERTLPDAFLRRCLHHHIELSEDQRRAAVRAHLDNVDESLLEAAIECFRKLETKELAHAPGLAELIVWLRALQLRKIDATKLRGASLAELPAREALLKDPQDLLLR